jgi:hypothetical protein
VNVGARRFSLAGLVSLCVSCGCLALVSAPALASLTHPFLGQFGSASFSNVQSIAVDQATGDVFVYDSGAGAIYKFNSSGAPEDFSFTKTNAITVPGAAKGEGEIAVDSSNGPAKGDIYLAYASSNVLVFNEAGEHVGELSETAGHPWGEVCGVAVDSSGNVYVGLHQNYVNRYVPTANPATNADYSGSLYGVDDVCNVAADSTGSTYVDTFAEEPSTRRPVTKYEALQFNMLEAPASATFAIQGGGTLAVEPSTNELYLDEGEQVAQLNASGEAIDTFAAAGAGAISESYGIAVDGSTHHVLVASGTGHVNVYGELGAIPDVFTGVATAEGAGSVELEGEVDPEGLPVTQCEFEYGSTTAYGQRVPCSTDPGSGHSYVKVTASVTGLTPLSEYHFRLVAGNTNGQVDGPDERLTAPVGAPMVEGESASEVSADSASLRAQINPEGAGTTYRFEYGTSEAYGQSTSESSLTGTGGSALLVVGHIQNLQPATTYHYRVVVANAIGQARGADQTFTTQSLSTSFALPDGRQYEMVSPPEKHGAEISAISEENGLIVAAEDGDALTFVTDIPTETETLGFDNHTQGLSVRGSDGWSSRDLTVPHGVVPGPSLGFGPEYRYFSSDLSHAIVQPLGQFTPCVNAEGASQPCLSPEASEQTAFLGTDFFNSNVDEPCLQAGAYCARPLVSGCPKAGEACSRVVEEHADVLPGTVFGGLYGGEGEGPKKRFFCHFEGSKYENGRFCGPEFVAATPDLRHILLSAEAKLTPEAPSPTAEARNFLYEWSDGHLTYVGEGFGGRSGDQNVVDPISAGGSRVVFGHEKYGSPKRLFMRDTADGELVQIGGSGAQFQAISSDGSRVFFLEGGDLYVYETTGGEGAALAGTTTSLTGGDGLSGEVVGVSEDGSYVYFVSEGVIAGSGASSPGNNLYVGHYTGSGWKSEFIAALSIEDAYDWDNYGKFGVNTQPTRVSSNGQWLAFMSSAPLTSYDNHDAVNGLPDAEVYLYHAATGERTSTLTCASCEPTGAQPTGIRYEELGLTNNGSGLQLEDDEAWGKEDMVAADVPGWQEAESGYGQPEDYQSRYLSNNGRLFFNSMDSLVPDDVDGTQDVYQYEPEGVGSCSSPSSSTGSVVFEPARDFEVEGRSGSQAAGCVGLISSGTSSVGSSFLDASQNGADVFFRTTSKLAPQDEDSAYDIYDAHECSALSPCSSVVVSVPPCETESSCRSSLTPQPLIYNAPPSATFSGPGDIEPPSPPPVATKVVKKASKCRKGLVKKRDRCVRKRPKRAKRTGKHGRTRR